MKYKIEISKAFDPVAVKINWLKFVLLPLLFVGIEASAQEESCVGEAGKLEWLIFETNSSNIAQNHFYPQSPSRIVLIKSLETERNYTDNYGSIIKGFLSVPINGKYYFNITGNETADFYLSSSESPDSAKLLVETSYTDYSEHNDNTAQTDSVDLESGKYYYFEVHHRESTGSDHVRVSWKTPGDTAIWKTIGGEFLFQYTCNEICPEKGTPCDDGNSQTSNDIYDGACNCFGIPDNKPGCAGEYGQVLALYYDSIPGNDVALLLSDPSYPLQPSRSEIFSEMRMPNRSVNDNFGTLVNTCLRVPVTGNYEFKVVGNTSAELYLGSSPTMDDLTLLARSSGSTKTVQLTAGQFYIMRLLHKENLNYEEFAALWKTPFHSDNEWKTIDGAYLYRYNCELACIPAGTPCNDNNPQTIKDKYDSNCNCAGIYCPDGDCPEAIVFQPYNACENTGNHGTHPDDSWLSCNTSLSPNPIRGDKHWIQYDLGSVMPIGTSHVWNYNVGGNTGRGFRSVAIDISDDRSSWEQIGVFDWPEAPGTNDYEGFDGPDFAGNSARYVLLTGLTNWNGDNCSGFSELKFRVAPCPGTGTPCNDHDTTTINDRYGSDCQCKGDLIVAFDVRSFESRFKLYPNPSDSWTNIIFYLEKNSIVNLDIFDISGRLVYQIARGQLFSSGYHQKLFPAQNLNAGTYLIRLQTADKLFSEKLIVVE